jgi:hypothetical protein
MRTERHLKSCVMALSCAIVATFTACQSSQQPIAPAATESKVPLAKEVYVVFEGPWAFAPDPKDANSVIALAPKTKSHRDLFVQTWDKTLSPGIYTLSLPTRSDAASGAIDPNILQAKIDPQSVQHVLDTKSERYAIRLPKPDAYVPATHNSSRAGAPYPPDASTEKDYATSVSLRYSVASLTGFSLAGMADTTTFNPLLLRVETPTINFFIEPAHDPDPADKCHTHEREAFRDLTKLVNVTLFLDFPNDPPECHAKDPQNSHPVKAEAAPRLPIVWGSAFAGGRKEELLAAIYFFGAGQDCKAPVIVSGN